MVKKLSHQIYQKEQDLNEILHLFHRTLAKYKKVRLEIPYDYAVTFVSDWRQASKTLIKDYLDILDVRGLIKIKKSIGKKMIIYEPKIEKEVFDVDKYFNEIKKSGNEND